MRIDRLQTTRLSSSSVLLSPLWPLLWLATRYALWSGRRRRLRRGRPAAPPDVERDLARLALSRHLLFSKGLVVVAEKPEKGGA